MITVLFKKDLYNDFFSAKMNYRLTNVEDDSEYANFMSRSRDKYEDALRSLPNLEPPSEFQYCPALQAELKVCVW